MSLPSIKLVMKKVHLPLFKAFDTNLVLYFKNFYNTDVGLFHFSKFTIRYSTDRESRLEYQESTIKMLEELFKDLHLQF